MSLNSLWVIEDSYIDKNKARLQRKLATRLAKQHILIVCEGEKTEPNYFDAFPVSSAEVTILGKGFNTKSLVNYAKYKAQEAKKNKVPYDQILCVFDKDSFTKGQFNTAIQMADQYGFKVAYSNEAFELWYVLHFEYLTAGIDREQYIKKLSKYLGKKYKKNSTEMYDILLSRQNAAIKNAKKLLKLDGRLNPADMIPSTTVHLLVEELNRLIK